MSEIPAAVQGVIDELVRQRDYAQSRALNLSGELAAAVAKVQELTPDEESLPEE